jgi:alanyl-tRNA synthetase
LFGEKYGDFARVLSIGDYSKEFCGGTHVGATSIIGIFKIVSEGSVGSGLRRIEALTGEAAHKFFFAQNERVNNASRLLKIPPEKIPERIKLFLDETKALRKTLESAKSQSPALEDALNKKVNIKGVNFVAYNFGSQDANSLKTLGDRVKDKLDPCVVVLASVSSGKVNLAATASRGALEKGADCGALIKKIAPIVNGAGGGRPNMAQAGGTGAANIEDALNAAKDWLEANI